VAILHCASSDCSMASSAAGRLGLQPRVEFMMENGRMDGRSVRCAGEQRRWVSEPQWHSGGDSEVASSHAPIRHASPCTLASLTSTQRGRLDDCCDQGEKKKNRTRRGKESAQRSRGDPSYTCTAVSSPCSASLCVTVDDGGKARAVWCAGCAVQFRRRLHWSASQAAEWQHSGTARGTVEAIRIE